MSTQPTNSAKFMEFHGIKLANGAAIANLVVEKLAAVPAVLEAGRTWFNTTTGKFQFVEVINSELVVSSVATVAELAAAIAALEGKLSSTDAGKGSALVGFSGQTGANGKFSVAAGTTENTLKAIVSGLDTEIKAQQDADKAAADALAATSGSTLVGYAGATGTNGKITVVAGTVDSAIDSLVSQVDAQFSSLGSDAVSKTATADQAIASNVTFAKNVIIDGDLSVLGDQNRIEGNIVELGDNIILLNKLVAVDAEPVADAGLSVNRGIKGELDFLLWDESSKFVTAPVVTVDGETGDETVVQSRVILGVEFDAFDLEVTNRLEVLEGQVNGKIGDLTTLHTTAKNSLVSAINEVQDELDTYKADVADNAKGATLVGFKGKAGANGLLVVAAGTVSASLEAIVSFADAEAKATDDYIVNVASNTAGKGSALVGFKGQGTVGTDKFALPAGSLEGSVSAVITAIKEDREAIEATNTSVSNLKSAINAQAYKTVSSSALVHTIVHNLGSNDISVDVWFKDGSVWVNHQAYTKIVDNNTVELTLTTAAEVKVLVKKFADLV